MRGTELSHHEWDFDKPPLSDEQTRYCFDYELSRITQSGPWRKGIHEFRGNGSKLTLLSNDKLYINYFEAAKKYESEYQGGELNWPRLFYSLWPEWPDKPFLSVDETERTSRIKKWESLFDNTVLPLEVFPVNKLIEEDRLIRSLKKTSNSEIECLSVLAKQLLTNNSIIRKELSKNDSSDISSIIRDPLFDLVAFKIDRWEKDNELVERFREWLVSRKRVSKLKKKRGPDFRKKLKALGCWRLINSGFKAVEAIQYTHLNSASKFPIYATEAKFSRAKKYAEREFCIGLAKLPNKRNL